MHFWYIDAISGKYTDTDGIEITLSVRKQKTKKRIMADWNTRVNTVHIPGPLPVQAADRTGSQGRARR